jgi:hypothetical protein
MGENPHHLVYSISREIATFGGTNTGEWHCYLNQRHQPVARRPNDTRSRRCCALGVPKSHRNQMALKEAPLTTFLCSVIVFPPGVGYVGVNDEYKGNSE